MSEDNPAMLLQGAWSLVSWTSHKPDGRVSHPFGENPTGRIMYQQSEMVACLIPTVPPEVTKDEPPKTPVSLSYFGTFTVQESDQTVTHRVTGSTVREWIGMDLVRRYEFSEAKLTLTANQPSGSVHQLVWQRLDQ